MPCIRPCWVTTTWPVWSIVLSEGLQGSYLVLLRKKTPLPLPPRSRSPPPPLAAITLSPPPTTALATASLGTTTAITITMIKRDKTAVQPTGHLGLLDIRSRPIISCKICNTPCNTTQWCVRMTMEWLNDDEITWELRFLDRLIDRDDASSKPSKPF